MTCVFKSLLLLFCVVAIFYDMKYNLGSVYLGGVLNIANCFSRPALESNTHRSL